MVLPLEEAGLGSEKKNVIKAFSEGWVWAERKWSQVSNDTGVGNPKFATKEKGERFFKVITEKMASLFVDLAEVDVDKMYE